MRAPFVKVTKNTGMNPVARAYAKAEFSKSITNYRINIFLNTHGQPALSDYLTIRVVTDATMGAMTDQDSLHFRKLKAAISVIDQAEGRGWTWDDADTITLDNALAIVQMAFPALPAKAANQSIQRATA